MGRPLNLLLPIAVYITVLVSCNGQNVVCLHVMCHAGTEGESETPPCVWMGNTTTHRCTPKKEPRHPVYRTLGGPLHQYGRVKRREKSIAHTGVQTPKLSLCCESPYRLRYLAINFYV